MRKGHHQGMHGSGSGHSGNLARYCICPACRYMAIHSPGFPCKTMSCPVCGASMQKALPTDFKSNNKDASTQTVEVKANQTIYPKVNKIKCTGCGKCIDACPTGTIQLINQKAFIETSNCRQCKLCIRICDEHAIYLE